MKITTASNMFEAAKKYCEENHFEEFEWANGVDSDTFKNLKSKSFLSNYCWVISIVPTY